MSRMATSGARAPTRGISSSALPQAATTLILALEAAPNTGGLLPVIAKSILPAVAASIWGGPEVKVENATS